MVLSWAALAAIVWVLAATVTAMLPMRLQYVPGITLLIAAPVLIIWLGAVHGWWLSILALLGFVSMFRNPLRYFWRRAKGERPEIPR